MALQLESLKNSIDALSTSLEVSQNVDSKNKALLETVRAGVIQNFEVAYEQSWKFIRRWLKNNYSLEEVEHPRTRKDIFRLAAEFGLINDVSAWFEYGDARNLTSHTYNKNQSIIVYNAAKNFLKDARLLIKQLQAAND